MTDKILFSQHNKSLDMGHYTMNQRKQLCNAYLMFCASLASSFVGVIIMILIIMLIIKLRPTQTWLG